MRASSNNHYQRSLPFTVTPIHSNKLSEDDTGYDSIPKQSPINSTDKFSSSTTTTSLSSSSNNQIKRIISLVKNIPSPTNISMTPNTSNLALSVEQRIERYSKLIQSTISPMRKLNRTRVQPILDSTSDSADSIALSNQQQIPIVSSIDIPLYGGSLEYIHDDRFDSTTTVDRLKNDVIAIELTEQQTNPIVDNLFCHKQQLSWIKRIGESIRLLPANVLAIIFISLVGGLIVSAILIVIIVLI